MKKRKAFAAMLAVMAMSLTALNAHADTDGTELQVVEPSQLTIQLGSEWVGVEFQLRTDSGVYPGVVVVDESGVLSLEIGGSSTYELSCLGSPQTVPTLEPEPSEERESEQAETEPATTSADTVTPTPDEAGDALTVCGIPVINLAVFGGGLLAAIVLLIALRLSGTEEGTPRSKTTPRGCGTLLRIRAMSNPHGASHI